MVKVISLCFLRSPLRIHHYPKNVLVLLGSFYSFWPLKQLPPLVPCLSAFIFFCLCSSVNYLLNEYCDRQADSHHPDKKERFFVQRSRYQYIVPLILLVQFVLLVVACYVFSGLSAFFLFLYFLNSILYNLLPFRLKDRFLLDVISESLNALLRFCFGHFVFAMTFDWQIINVIFFLYFFALVLMFNKRRKDLSRLSALPVVNRILYRKSLQFYSERSLKNFIGLSLILTTGSIALHVALCYLK